MTSFNSGVAQVLLAGVLFGFIGIFARFAYQSGISVGDLVSLRVIFAAISLWLLVLLFSRRHIRLNAKQIYYSLALGIFGYSTFSTLYFAAIQGMSVPLAVMILFTFPSFVSLGAHFFLKERLIPSQIISLLIASSGLVLLLWGNFNIQNKSAILFALGSSLSYSAYVLISSKVQKDIQPLSSSLYIITGAAVTLGLYHKPSLKLLSEYNLHQWLILIGIATVSTVAPLTLFLAGLQKLKSSRATLLVTIEPVIAVIASALLLNETLSALQGLGGALIITAVLLDMKRGQDLAP